MKVTILKPNILLPVFLFSSSGCPVIPRPNISPESCLLLHEQVQDSHWELAFRFMFLSPEMLSNSYLFIYLSSRIDTNVTSLEKALSEPLNEIRLLYYIFLGSIKLYFLISVPISVGNGTFFLHEQWLTYVLTYVVRLYVMGGPVAQSLWSSELGALGIPLVYALTL